MTKLHVICPGTKAFDSLAFRQAILKQGATGSTIPHKGSLPLDEAGALRTLQTLIIHGPCFGEHSIRNPHSPARMVAAHCF
jgi:hypothetical protein